MNAPVGIAGYLPRGHALSPYAGYGELRVLGRWLADYEPRDLWALDNQRLPWSLRRLRGQVRDFAETEVRPLAARMDQAPHRAPGDDDPELGRLLAAAGRAGLLALVLPWPLGSARWSQYRHAIPWAYSLLTEELARVDGGLMLLLCAHYLGLYPLLLNGDAGLLWRDVLPALRATRRGDPQLFAYAITEPGAGSDAEDGYGAAAMRPGVIARRVSGGWTLHGRKCFISGGDRARWVVVFAALETEGVASWTPFLVAAESPGFQVRRTELKMGMRASGAAELEFDGVFVADARVVGPLRGGWALNRATLNGSRIPVAAMAVGFATAATEAALIFSARSRLAGRRLLDYQEIQLQLADLVAETRALRALVWHHARHNRVPRQFDASLCKFQASDRAQKVCEAALELIGADPGPEAYAAGKAFRDVRLTRIFEGTNQINRLAMLEDWQPQWLQMLDTGTVCGV